MIKKLLATICSTIFALNSLLHAALILGAPLGEYVLGGQHVVYPLEMRLISLLLMFLWAYVAYAYLQQGNIMKNSTQKTRTIIILSTIFMIFAIFSNGFITTSKKEKALMTPLAIVTSLSSLTLLYLTKKEPS